MNKERILEEIRRTAKANGGQPLGWRKFITETGIPQSDWFGIHWARWSDAIKEAGFEPNSLVDGYGAEALLEKIARLALRLGRLPTNADMRLEAGKNGFPSDKTFGRLGTRDQLVTQLKEFCDSRAEYSAVAALCDTFKPRVRRQADAANEEAALGVIYLIKSGRYFKIGRTKSSVRREYELSIQLPEKVTTIHTIETDDPVGIEAYWHRRFAPKRKNGEWFELEAGDIAAFKRRTFM